MYGGPSGRAGWPPTCIKLFLYITRAFSGVGYGLQQHFSENCNGFAHVYTNSI